MKVLIKSAEGMRLENFMKKHAASLNHSRALYVISANMEKKSVYKIGIAGTTQAKPIRRFESYIIAYGKYDNTNSCRGVLIHFCGVTEYNRRVLANKSQVAQVELKLKQDLKTTGSLALGRGTERVLTTKKSIKEIIETIEEITPNLKETPIEITRVARDKTKRYRTDDRAFIYSKTWAEENQLISSRTRSKTKEKPSNKKQ